MSQENLELARRSYEAFDRGDYDAVLEAFDPEIEWEEPDISGVAFSGERHGREHLVEKVFEPVRREVDDFEVVPEEFLDAGDHVVVLGRYRGHGRDTGITLDAPFAHVWTMRGGKAVRHRDYYDTANWLRSLAGLAM
jgi:ketosteroid isomerase-like protein